MMAYNSSWLAPVPYEFEKCVDRYDALGWFEQKGHISLYLSAIYLLVIFGVREYMKHRPALELKKPLIVWNLALAIFSIAGSLRMQHGLVYMLNEFGVIYSLCGNVYELAPDSSAFWALLFVLSKVVELGDTLLLVLRKRNLTFLHWYHHALTMVVVFHLSSYRIAIAQWLAVMNYTVHALMYTYFALRAMNIKVPKRIAMSITILQITQMVIGFILASFVVYLQRQGYSCKMTKRLYLFGGFFYSSYLLLFANFFYKAYLSGTSKHLHSKKSL